LNQLVEMDSIIQNLYYKFNLILTLPSDALKTTELQIYICKIKEKASDLKLKMYLVLWPKRLKEA